MEKCDSHSDAVREWECWDCEGKGCGKCNEGKVYTCDQCDEEETWL